MEVLRRTFPHAKGTDTQAVEAGVDASGAFTINVTDSGPGAEALLGDWDYETGIRIDPADMARLWPRLVRALMTAETPLDLEAIIALCAEASVDPHRWSWS